MSLKPKYDPFLATRYTAAQQKAQKAVRVEFNRLLHAHISPIFKQARTERRVMGMVLGMLQMGPGRKTITNNLVSRGLDQEDWTSDYRAIREGAWNCEDIFKGVFNSAVPLLLAHPGPVILGVDETGLPKEGMQIENVDWIHAPLREKFIRPAVQWGVPMLHAAILLPGPFVHLPTTITVAFEPIPREKQDKKKGEKKSAKGMKSNDKRAPAQDDISPQPPPPPAVQRKLGRPTKEESVRLKGLRDMATNGAVSEIRLKGTELTVQVIHRVRRWMDEAGMVDRLLLVCGDGAYTNGTVMLNLPDRTEYVGRARPDARLQGLGVTRRGKVKYGDDLQTPVELVESGAISLIKGKFHYGGHEQELSYYAIGPLFRKGSTLKKPLRLLILEPVNFEQRKAEGKNYNQRCFLLTTDFQLAPEELVQGFLYRWGLEQAHRDYKDTLGIGQAQTRSQRITAAMVGLYSLLHVAIRKALGEERAEGYTKVPKWVANKHAWLANKRRVKGESVQTYRPSVRDITHIFRCAMARKGTKVLNLAA